MSSTMPKSNFEEFLARALKNPETRAAFEDSQSRSRLIDALVRMRHRLGMTQTQLAKQMGVKQPSVSGFETEGSDPRLSTIQRYARSVDAVLVLDVRPRMKVAYADPYAPGRVKVHLGVNTEKPTERAKAWTPTKPYGRRLHAVA